MSEPNRSRISKIIDWLYATVPSVLPEHIELLNPDDLFENPTEVLAKGWGISIGDGENTERCLGTEAYHWRREFTVIVTQDLLAIAGDQKSVRDKQKLALEWCHALLKMFTASASIADPDGSGDMISFKADVLRDSGPRQITVNDADYIFVELTLALEYRERTA